MIEKEEAAGRVANATDWPSINSAREVMSDKKDSDAFNDVLSELNTAAMPVDVPFELENGQHVEQIVIKPAYNSLARLAFATALGASGDSKKVKRYLNGNKLGFCEDGSIGLTFESSTVTLAGLRIMYENLKDNGASDSDTEAFHRVNVLTTAIVGAWLFGHRKETGDVWHTINNHE